LKGAIAAEAQRDRFRDHLAEVLGAELTVVQPPLQFFQTRLLRSDEQLAQARISTGWVPVGPRFRRRLAR
jgi:hypothetical protein